MLQLLGRHLKFDPYLRDEKQNIIGENEDEGVFIASEQGEWQRLSIYSETGDKRVTALIPADIEDEELRLKVATRLKGEVVQEGTYGKFIKKSGVSLNGNGGDEPDGSDSPNGDSGAPDNSGGGQSEASNHKSDTGDSTATSSSAQEASKQADKTSQEQSSKNLSGSQDDDDSYLDSPEQMQPPEDTDDSIFDD
jgi:hypothetical protein